MAVPKRRMSRSNTRHRRAQWKATSSPALVPIVIDGREYRVPRRLVREIDERIHALLGDDRYAYYANYERTLPWRARFLDLAKVLRSVDPLTDEQIDSLVTWTAEASPHLFTSHSKGDPRLPEGLLDRARSILSPLQQRKLQEAQAADAAQLALDRIAEATQ